MYTTVLVASLALLLLAAFGPVADHQTPQHQLQGDNTMTMRDQTAGELFHLIDELKTQLDRIINLQIIDENAQAIPNATGTNNAWALVKDFDRNSYFQQTAFVTEQRNQAVYQLEVVIGSYLNDPTEAYNHLEKFISRNSISSINTAVRGVILEGLPAWSLQSSGPRRIQNIAGTNFWTVSFQLASNIY